MPYSHSPSGVALECKDGRITGSYAENAAFNPTPPAARRAKPAESLTGYDYAIFSAILAEKAIIQWDATAATLKAR